jgi:competence protein ComEA
MNHRKRGAQIAVLLACLVFLLTCAGAAPPTQTVIFNEEEKVNINTATATELATLPGIGAITAQKIIQNRPYADVWELGDIDGIGDKTLDNIIDRVEVSAVGQTEANIFQGIIGNSDSSLIFFFIIMVVALLPLYAAYLKDRSNSRKVNTELEKEEIRAATDRENRLLEALMQTNTAFTHNTEIMAGLKTLLESSSETTRTSFARIHDRIDENGEGIASMLAGQGGIAGDVKLILAAVNSLKHE